MFEFVNLDNFEDLELIANKGEYEFHKIRQKDTDTLYYAIIYTDELEDIGKNQITNLYRELSIYPTLNHPSIVKFIGYSPVNFSSDPNPVIITEYSPMHALNPSLFTDNTKKLIVIYGIASAMSYMHSHDVIHRDLKFDNISIDDRLFPKIGGFHLCKEINPDAPEQSHFIKGTPAYLAPEIITNHEYSKASDVYSFSLLFYQLMTNDDIYQDISERPDLLFQRVTNGERPNKFGNLPLCYRNLIEKCWSQKPSERPTFEEIVEQLRNDPQFAIDGVQNDEFKEYVKYIDNAEVTFDKSRGIRQNDDFFESRNFEFNFCVQTIFDTELDNVNLYMRYFDLKNFTKERKIGIGRFSNTYEIIYHDSSGIRYAPFAAKIFNEKLTDLYDIYSQEVIINSQLNHPCICRFIGYNPASFNGKKYPIVVSECCPNSSLDVLMSLERKKIHFHNWNETTKLIIAYGIASGMAYMHSQNIVHRDLNPTNIFLDINLFPKIGDFGTADYFYDQINENKQFNEYKSYNENKQFNEYKELNDNQNCNENKQFNEYKELNENQECNTKKECNENNGSEKDDYSDEGDEYYDEYSESFVINKTPRYMAPETLMDNLSNKASDVYSFGLILYELITNEIPFDGLNSYEIVKTVVIKEKRPNFNKEIPSCYRNLIENCWSQNYQERPTFDSIVSLLRTDKSFITEGVENETFQKYIQFIDGLNVAFEKVPKEDIMNTHYDLIRKDTNQLSITVDSIDLSRFEINKEDELGEGSFGKVYKVIEKETGQIFAAKILNRYLEDYNNTLILNMTREVNNMSELNFPSIVSFVGHSPFNFNQKPKLTIITEFVPNGTLDDMIDNGEENWNETKRLIAIYGIAAGMAHSHSHNIIHRDLKPANVFLNESFHPKIGDFGLSKNILFDDKKINDSELKSGIKGSYAFLAPEVFTDLKYDKAGDVYAFSLIVYQLLTKSSFYRSSSRYKIMLGVPNGLRPELNDDIPQCYRKLISKCWEQNPEERLTFDEIVYLIKNDENFITQNVDKKEFLDYVHKIDELS